MQSNIITAFRLYSNIIFSNKLEKKSLFIMQRELRNRRLPLTCKIILRSVKSCDTKLNEFYTIEDICTLLDISKDNLHEKCNQYKIDPLRNEIGQGAAAQQTVL